MIVAPVVNPIIWERGHCISSLQEVIPQFLIIICILWKPGCHANDGNSMIRPVRASTVHVRLIISSRGMHLCVKWMYPLTEYISNSKIKTSKNRNYDDGIIKVFLSISGKWVLSIIYILLLVLSLDFKTPGKLSLVLLICTLAFINQGEYQM